MEFIMILSTYKMKFRFKSFMFAFKFYTQYALI